jgi:hypothetical protein
VIESFEVLRERGRIALARGDVPTALTALRAAAARTDAPQRDYVQVLQPLAELLKRTKDPRGALTVIAYLASARPAQWEDATALLPDVTPNDRARVLAAQSRTSEAAREAELSGNVASAAFFQEMGGQWHAARALWARLASLLGSGAAIALPSQQDASGENRYIAALVHFNLARCAKQCGDTAQTREAAIACVRLLEEAADRFESIGQRERAFDCFQVLTQIGRESGAFEDVLEGFVNCIRILREDHLKDFALQHYEEAIDTAIAWSEMSAAATLAREAAGYARSLGLLPRSNGFVSRQGDLWRACAKEHVARGAPAAIAENALLASALAYGQIGQASCVRQVYEELERLDLDPARREHYGRGSRRYGAMKDEPVETTFAPARSDKPGSAEGNEVWRVDVLEWERNGSASEACTDVMLDRRYPEFIRRTAMLARMTALEAERRLDDSSQAIETARARLAHELSLIQLYAVLSPLEHLFAQSGTSVKVAVLRGITTLLFFKRSFATVRAGLADSDPSVVAEAIRAVASIDTAQAFDPLSRLVRESLDPNTRAAALKSLARIDTTEAKEFLRGVLEHGFPADRLVVADALRGRRT